MKKHILPLFLLLFILCSCSSDDDPTATNPNSISPPAWIQGTWFGEDDVIGFKFTNDDFCEILGNDMTVTMETCYKETVDMVQGSIEQTSTDNFYSIKITFPLGASSQTKSVEFEKVSNNKIKWFLSREDDLFTIITKI